MGVASVLKHRHVTCGTVRVRVASLLYALLLGSFVLLLVQGAMVLSFDTDGSVILTSGDQDQPTGRWVPGARYKNACLQLKTHGCCNNSRPIHFAFSDRRLAHGDQLEAKANKLLKRNITFLGDSVMKDFFEGFLEVFNITAEMEKQEVVDEHNITRAEWFTVDHRTHRSHVQFRYLYFYTYETLHCKKKTQSLMINSTYLLHYISDTDIVILNIGLHYHFCPLFTFTVSLQKLAEVLSAAARFFEDNDMECAKVKATTPHPTNVFLKNYATQFRFLYLDTFALYAERYDLHSVFNRADCTHYCFCPELIVPEVIMLAMML